MNHFIPIKFNDTQFFPDLPVPSIPVDEEENRRFIEEFLPQAYDFFIAAVEALFAPKERKKKAAEAAKESTAAEKAEMQFVQFVAEKLMRKVSDPAFNAVLQQKTHESLNKYIKGIWGEKSVRVAAAAKEHSSLLKAAVATEPLPAASKAAIEDAKAKLQAERAAPALERWRFDDGLFQVLSSDFPEFRYACGLNDVLEQYAVKSKSGQCQHDFGALAKVKAYSSNSEKFVDFIRLVLLQDGGKKAAASAEPVATTATEAAAAAAKSALDDDEHTSLPNSKNCWKAFSTIRKFKDMLPKLAAILIKAILCQNGREDQVSFVACDEKIEEFEACNGYLPPHLKAEVVNEAAWSFVQNLDRDRLWFDAYTKFSKQPSVDGSSSGVPVVESSFAGSVVGGGGGDGGDGGGGGGGGDGGGGGGGGGHDGAVDSDDVAAQEKSRNGQQKTFHKHLTLEAIRCLEREIRTQSQQCLQFDCPKMYPKGTDIQALEAFKFFLQEEWFCEVGVELCMFGTNCVLQCGLWCNAFFNIVTSFRSKPLTWNGY
jgi:hypothetical protein